jgi:hypothetical protein
MNAKQRRKQLRASFRKPDAWGTAVFGSAPWAESSADTVLADLNALVDEWKKPPVIPPEPEIKMLTRHDSTTLESFADYVKVLIEGTERVANEEWCIAGLRPKDEHGKDQGPCDAIIVGQVVCVSPALAALLRAKGVPFGFVRSKWPVDSLEFQMRPLPYT